MNNLKIKYIIASVLQLVCIVFWFIPACTVVVSYRYIMGGEVVDITTKEKSLMGLFEGGEFLAAISIIGLVVSLALLILPLIKSSEEKRRRLIFSKISAIYPVFALLLLFIPMYASPTQPDEVSSGFKFGFGGVLLVVLNIALLVILCMISSESKKLKKASKKTVSYPNLNNPVPQNQTALPNNTYAVNQGNIAPVRQNAAVNQQNQPSVQAQGFKFCKRCGNKIASTANFCSKCGFRF